MDLLSTSRGFRFLPTVRALARAAACVAFGVAGGVASGVASGVACGTAPGDDAAQRTSSLTSASPVAAHGRLSIGGGKLRDEHGAAVQLRGMSLFWSQWSPAFYAPAVVGTVANAWRGSVIRAAMGVEMGGYLDNPEAEKKRVVDVVDAAIANGIYVIVDWHDHSASKHTEASKAFFREMATKYRNVPNVIFEIFNEPDDEAWPEVKGYAEQVLREIRGAGAENVVVVGTPTWSQDVDVAARDPLTGFSNVAYTLHFYAGTHKAALRDKAAYALDHGLALFATEWGACDASGNGGLDLDESTRWLAFLDERGVSWANWSLFDKDETASALRPGTGAGGNWPDAALTASGALVKRALLAGAAEGGGGSSGGGGPTPPTGGDVAMTFAVSPNVNPWWIQVRVEAPGRALAKVTASVNGRAVPLAYQWWGDWAASPLSPVPAGAAVVITAVDDRGGVATYTTAPWPAN